MKLQVILILFISLSLEAQNVEIKGRIIDGESGAALPDAYIVYQKKSLAAIADRDGSFNISIPEELIDGDTIYLTHLGYITLPVSCQKAINMVEFEMKPASYALPEIEIRVPER